MYRYLFCIETFAIGRPASAFFASARATEHVVKEIERERERESCESVKMRARDARPIVNQKRKKKKTKNETRDAQINETNG